MDFLHSSFIIRLSRQANDFHSFFHLSRSWSVCILLILLFSSISFLILLFTSCLPLRICPSSGVYTVINLAPLLLFIVVKFFCPVSFHYCDVVDYVDHFPPPPPHPPLHPPPRTPPRPLPCDVLERIFQERKKITFGLKSYAFTPQCDYGFTKPT